MAWLQSALRSAYRLTFHTTPSEEALPTMHIPHAHLAEMLRADARGLKRIVLGPIEIPPAPLSESALCDWVAQAQPGAQIQYHAGHLLVDRSAAFSVLEPRERESIDRVAKRAWLAMEIGLVHLLSYRIADFHYRYVAVRSALALPPTTPAAPQRPHAPMPIRAVLAERLALAVH